MSIRFILSSLALCSACSSSTGMPDLRTQLTPGTIAKLPVKVMLIELPKANSAALSAIDTVKGDSVTWRTLEDQSITIEEGVIIATRGLAFDLMGSNVGRVPADIFSYAEGGASAVRSFSFLDGENVMHTVSYECFYETGSSAVRRLIGQANLSFVKEHCVKSGADIENFYYFDARGQQVTSTQWLGDTLGYATVEFVN